jgi:DNA-binding transcriptional MocR family regulator
MLLQAGLAEFVSDGSYERHLRKLRRELLDRRDAMLSALRSEMPDSVGWTEPEGGYQVWVELPEGVDTGELLADAVGAGVLFAPGYQFNHDGRTSSCLRLSYAMADIQQLQRGVKILARLVRARLANGTRSVARVHI